MHHKRNIKMSARANLRRLAPHQRWQMLRGKIRRAALGVFGRSYVSRSHAVRRGACLGKNGGVVATIRTGEVVVSEWAIKADGTRDKTQTVVRLPKEPSLNLEE